MSPDLSIQKNAKRVCIYIGESDHWRGKPLYAAILETLKANAIAGATVVRGVAGFGAHSRIHTAAILRLSEDLPLRIEAIDSPEKITKALEAITPMVSEGLITVDDVQVIRYTHRYLNPLPADKPISEVMTRQVVTLSPDMTIAQAWERMLEHSIKAMPVVDEQQHVLGILTDEDLIHRAGLQQHLSVAARLDQAMLDEQLAVLRNSTLKVADVMTQPVITANSSEFLRRWSCPSGKTWDQAPAGRGCFGQTGRSGRQSGCAASSDGHGNQGSEIAYPRRSGFIGAASDVRRYSYCPDGCRPGNDLVEVLVETCMRRLVVVDTQNRPVGLISDFRCCQPHPTSPPVWCPRCFARRSSARQ